MRPPEDADGDGDAELRGPDEFLPLQLLPSIQNCGEGHDGGAGLELVKGLAKANLQTPIAMPDGEEVMADQSHAGHEHEAAADPEGVGETPQNLSDGLRMPADADDPRGVKTHLGFQHCRDFQQVVSGWIEEQKADGCSNPHERNHARDALQIPKPHPVVAMGQKPSDHHHGRGNAGCREDQPPSPCSDHSLSAGAQGCSTAVNHRKQDQQQQHHDAAVVSRGHGRLVGRA